MDFFGGATRLFSIGADASTPGQFIFQTSTTTSNLERARIDSSGRLLVGTSTSASTGSFAQYAFLQVKGNTSNAASSAIFNLQRGEGAATITTGEGLGLIDFTDNAGNSFGFIACDADGTAGSGDYPGRLVFSTTADGASSPTERMRITSTGQMRLAGAGITFNGDTATANELDDYEEGTFSPTLQGLSVAGAIGYVRNNGRYTKVGNIVHIAVDIKVDAISVVPTGGLVFASLPFTSANVEGNFAYPGAVRLNGVSLPAGSLGAYAIMLNNSTLARIQTLIDNAAPGSIDGSNLATNDELQWSCTYRTA
jgi:hypothetical protein